MSTLPVPIGGTITVIGDDVIEYNGVRYHGVTQITLDDGSIKTPAQIITEAGGSTYAPNELKTCVKVEGYDPDAADRQIFTVYSNNSRQTSKNQTGSVPGGMWCEIFDFLGTKDTNAILKLWSTFPRITLSDGTPTGYQTTWRGFKLNYGTTQTVAYTLTQANAFLEESVPCPPVLADLTYMNDARLGGKFRNIHEYIRDQFYVPIWKLYLYRSTVVGDTEYAFRRVEVEPVADNEVPDFPRSTVDDHGANWFGYTITDNTREEDLSFIALESLDWDAPPTRECQGLTAGWNGMLFAFWRNELIPFEPYRPHAAPRKYRISFPYDIIALETDGNSLLVLTAKQQYVVMGAHPASLTYEALINATQGALPTEPVVGESGEYRRESTAVTKTPMGVVYASDEGLVLVRGGQAALITDKLYTKVEWQERWRNRFGSMRLFYSNEKVYVAYNSDDNPVFGPTQAEMILTENGALSQLDGHAIRSTFALPGSDGVYVVEGEDRPFNLLRWEDYTQPRKAWLWTSKKFILPAPINLGCFQAIGFGSVTAEFFAGSQTAYHTQTVVADGTIHRLPAGFKSREYQVRLSGTENSTLREFYMAETPLELRSV